MATDAASRLRQAAKLIVALLVVGPALVQFGFVGSELVPSVEPALLVRLAGFAVVLAVGYLLVRQKRRTRGRRPTEGAPERPEDRQVEGSGEVYAPYAYNNQQEARRETDRIRERAERVSESERDAYDR